MIGWVVKRHFGTEQSLEELVERKFLTDNEYHTLMEGQRFLWKAALRAAHTHPTAARIACCSITSVHSHNSLATRTRNINWPSNGS